MNNNTIQTTAMASICLLERLKLLDQETNAQAQDEIPEGIHRFGVDDIFNSSDDDDFQNLEDSAELDELDEPDELDPFYRPAWADDDELEEIRIYEEMRAKEKSIRNHLN